MELRRKLRHAISLVDSR